MTFFRHCIALGAAVIAAPATAATLTIAISGVRDDRGVVHVDICRADEFLTDRCPYSSRSPAQPGTTVVTIRDIPPGRYAAQAFHDENANGRVDRALFGIPKEGVGFSNDAPIRLAPPKFADAAFTIAGQAQAIRLKLRYFLGAPKPRRSR